MINKVANGIEKVLRKIAGKVYGRNEETFPEISKGLHDRIIKLNEEIKKTIEREKKANVQD